PSNFKEINSHWIVFQSSKSQKLEFSLAPLRSNDDLDFIVFSAEQVPLRCVASGINVGETFNNYSCNKKTGLISEENKKVEFRGCEQEDTNFASTLMLEKEAVYYIYIHNSTSNGGARLRFISDLAVSPVINITKEDMFVDNSHMTLINTDYVSQIEELTWNLNFAEPSFSTSKEEFSTELNLLKKENLTKRHTLKNTCVIRTEQKISGIPENSISVDINSLSIYSLYPNPTNSLLNVVVENKKSTTPLEIKIISTKGEIILSQTELLPEGMTEIQLNLSNIAAQNLILSLTNQGVTENFQITKI
ncbi:T9SS type A sorting domain-containing protein, partial [Saprospiraceae bacterium]|nr:T9SS type A sorting domain-containing protein [Saprospiraceae bacterium]